MAICPSIRSTFEKFKNFLFLTVKPFIDQVFCVVKWTVILFHDRMLISDQLLTVPFFPRQNNIEYFWQFFDLCCIRKKQLHERSYFKDDSLLVFLRSCVINFLCYDRIFIFTSYIRIVWTYSSTMYKGYLILPCRIQVK